MTSGGESAARSSRPRGKHTNPAPPTPTAEAKANKATPGPSGAPPSSSRPLLHTVSEMAARRATASA